MLVPQGVLILFLSQGKIISKMLETTIFIGDGQRNPIS